MATLLAHLVLSNLFNLHVNYQWNFGRRHYLAIGPFEGLRLMRTFVEDCIVYNVSPRTLIRRVRDVGRRMAVYGNLRYISGDDFECKE